MNEPYTLEELKALLYKEQVEELDIPKQPTNIEFINEKYGKMPDSYILKQMYPSKQLREHLREGEPLPNMEILLMMLSPLVPYIAVWLILIFYVST